MSELNTKRTTGIKTNKWTQNHSIKILYLIARNAVFFSHYFHPTPPSFTIKTTGSEKGRCVPGEKIT